jgi:ATP-binding protein involved in chromosome partitioning
MSLRERIERRLDDVKFPGFPHSLARYGVVHEIVDDDGDVTVRLLPVSRKREIADAIVDSVRSALGAIDGIRSVRIETAAGGVEERPSSATPQAAALPGVAKIIAVSSCKGGVGKSTVAVNLAVALQRRGLRVGLLDADVYGPSAPLMFGTDARPRPVGKKITPIERYGVEIMSMGFFLDDSSPVIWRGPMVMSLVRQFLYDVEWGTLDVLVVDMPPGTGDAALTLAQQVPVSGAVIVTTPQEVALQDVERGIAMFRQVQVPVLGIVENMAYYLCPDCGERDEIFGSGGGESIARQFHVPLLARLPLVAELRVGGDEGRPLVVAKPDHEVSRSFESLARSVTEALASTADRAVG